MRVFQTLDQATKVSVVQTIQDIICDRMYDLAKQQIVDNPGVIECEKTLHHEDYQTFLHCALRNTNPPLWFIGFLVEQGADVNARTSGAYRYNKPLEVAHNPESDEVYHYLLDCGATGVYITEHARICIQKRQQLHNKNVALAWALKQQGVPKDVINQICEEFWELRTK